MRISARYFVPLVLVLISVPAAAQRRPGAAPVDPSRAGAARAAYNQDVLQEHDRLMRDWMRAWSQQDKEEAAEAYAIDATVVFGMERAAGRPGVEQWLDGKLPDIGEVRTALTEFRASGGLAFGSGTFEYQPRGAAGAAPVTGSYFAVLVMERGRWKYQAQIFMPTDTSSSAATAPASAVGPSGPSAPEQPQR